jgi:hypothetical protein
MLLGTSYENNVTDADHPGGLQPSQKLIKKNEYVNKLFP